MTGNQQEQDICGFDDLSMVVAAGRPSLSCPLCGSIAVPLREPTLSDFTNAALVHLADVHAVRRQASTDLAPAA